MEEVAEGLVFVGSWASRGGVVVSEGVENFGPGDHVQEDEEAGDELAEHEAEGEGEEDEVLHRVEGLNIGAARRWDVWGCLKVFRGWEADEMEGRSLGMGRRPLYGFCRRCNGFFSYEACVRLGNRPW